MLGYFGKEFYFITKMIGEACEKHSHRITTLGHLAIHPDGAAYFSCRQSGSQKEMTSLQNAGLETFYM